MDKRRETRHKVRQLVNISDKVGILNDISRKGANISLSSFPEQRKVDLTIKINGEDAKMSAIVMWAEKKQHYSGQNTMGMILIDPPPSFIEYCTSMDNEE